MKLKNAAFANDPTVLNSERIYANTPAGDIKHFDFGSKRTTVFHLTQSDTPDNLTVHTAYSTESYRLRMFEINKINSSLYIGSNTMRYDVRLISFLSWIFGISPQSARCLSKDKNTTRWCTKT